MENQVPGWTLGELAQLLNGELRGPAELRIARPVPADGHDELGLTFAETEEFLRQAGAGGAAAVLIPKESEFASKPAIAVDRPRESFGRFLAMCARPLPINAAVHPTAIVSPEASVATTASIGPYAVIERGARIGEHVRVHAFSYVGENCQVGDGSVLFPHVVLYQDVTVGARAILHSGAVLGADGFGFVWDGQRRVKVPQVGGVSLGDDVEVGANTCVDRATMGQTTIAGGTKLDNLVQIGHNSRIGAHTVIASQTGIAGSTRIGDRVTIAGQAATSDHVSVADDVTLAGRTGVTNDIKEKGTYFGLPARPVGDAIKSMVLSTKLPELFRRLREVERKLEETK